MQLIKHDFAFSMSGFDAILEFFLLINMTKTLCLSLSFFSVLEFRYRNICTYLLNLLCNKILLRRISATAITYIKASFLFDVSGVPNERNNFIQKVNSTKLS